MLTHFTEENTMRTLAITTLLAIVPLTGCVYYECAGADCDPWAWEDDDCWEDDCWDDDCWEDDCWDDEDDCDTDEEEDPYLDEHGFWLTPYEVEQGAGFIASLQAEDEGISFEEISTVHINGQVSIGAMDARSNELLLFVEVAPTAEVGEADIFVTLGEEMVMLEQPLVIYEAGSGYPVDQADEPEC